MHVLSADRAKWKGWHVVLCAFRQCHHGINITDVGGMEHNHHCYLFFIIFYAISHLGFLKVQHLCGMHGVKGRCASAYIYFMKLVKRLSKYGKFLIFKMVADRHIGFVWGIFGVWTTHKQHFVVLYHCAKNACGIQSPKIGIVGDYTIWMESVWTKYQKRYTLAWVCVIMSHQAENLVTNLTCISLHSGVETGGSGSSMRTGAPSSWGPPSLEPKKFYARKEYTTSEKLASSFSLWRPAPRLLLNQGPSEPCYTSNATELADEIP